VFAEEVLDFLKFSCRRSCRACGPCCAAGADIVSSKYKMRTVTLGNFDRDAAVAFLEGRGIDNQLVAARVFDQVGGSPLVLRLAADVARLEKVTTDASTGCPAGWSTFWTQSIEVVLYKRILSHVYDNPREGSRVSRPDPARDYPGRAAARASRSRAACRSPPPADAAALVTLIAPSKLSTILTTAADRETLGCIARTSGRSC